jgi:hypothetical protein
MNGRTLSPPAVTATPSASTPCAEARQFSPSARINEAPYTPTDDGIVYLPSMVLEPSCTCLDDILMLQHSQVELIRMLDQRDAQIHKQALVIRRRGLVLAVYCLLTIFTQLYAMCDELCSYV